MLPFNPKLEMATMTYPSLLRIISPVLDIRFEVLQNSGSLMSQSNHDSSAKESTASWEVVESLFDEDFVIMAGQIRKGQILEDDWVSERLFASITEGSAFKDKSLSSSNNHEELGEDKP